MQQNIQNIFFSSVASWQIRRSYKLSELTITAIILDSKEFQ